MAACTPQDPVAAWSVPEGATLAAYAPLRRLTTFPDDVHTVDDPSRTTGLRVVLQGEARGDLVARVPDTINLLHGLEALDGFGTTAAVTLRFTEPIDPSSLEARFLRVDDSSDVPFELATTDGGATLFLEPLRPLAERTTYAVLIRSLADAEGHPVYPSAALWALTHGTATEPELARVVPAWSRALRAAGLASDDVVAGTVFTTQDLTTQEDEVLALLDGLEPRLEPAGPCVLTGRTTWCPTTLRVAHPMGEDRTLTPRAAPSLDDTYELSVDVYLPGEGGAGPYPVLFFGHGLAGDRGEARGVADDLADLGFAVVAVDAPAHGDHPTATPQDGVFQALDFFGVDWRSGSMDVGRLRDGFRLATWDKLQLADAVRAGIDLDGDGVSDLDATELHWTGHSLGGIMGVPLVALDPGFVSAHLSVPGGRVSNIVHRGDTFSPLIALMAPPGTVQGEIDRFFPMLQTAVELGEPANLAARLVDRDVFATLVVGDEIIPNSSGRFMARALDVTLYGPEHQRVEGLAVSAAPLPVSGNRDGRTAVLYQYVQMVDDGVEQQATHSHIYRSETHLTQLRHWLLTLAPGPAEVIAP